MNHPSRRQVLSAAATTGLVTLAGINAATAGAQELVAPAGADKPAAAGKDPWHGLKVGVASYSLRGLKLDAAVAAIQRVGLSYVSIKDMHLPLNASAEARRAVAGQLKAAGITPLSCGVVTMKNDEAECRVTFEYARDLAMPVIVCNPDADALPLLDKLVKEFDLKLAIHNHGPESKLFKSPYDVMKAVEQFDPRIGVCVDVGHTARAGVDPAEAIRNCAPRLYDVHLKDVAILDRPNNGVEIGRGLLDVRAMLQALLDVKFAHHSGIEFEKDPKDVLPGLAESVGYLKGVMSGLGGA